MDQDENLPYLAEYAKSSRASCKLCMSLIEKDSLRIALMVQSRHFDGKQPNWHHYTCFFGRCRPKCVDEIGKFHNLRWNDQEKIRAQIERVGGSSKESGSKKSLKDFVIQYALSNRSTCKKCEEKIEKDEIRISHKEIDPEKPQVGLIDRWHHVGCFLKRRKELGWDDSKFTADMITGFKALDTEDKATISKHLNKKTKKAKKPTVKVKEEVDENAEKINKMLRDQSAKLWKVIDQLKGIDI
uniref:PARP-type domain-containing protein n=1 Tax=Ciona savignyi TaxID=51511 RepID=H2Y8F3_CIOSA